MERTLKSWTLGIGGAMMMLGGTLLTPLAAHAGADGRKNTTIALGAAAAYELLLKHQVVPGLVLGAGAAYAEKGYEDSRRSERDNNNRNYYRRGSSHGYNNGYNNNNYNRGNNNNNGYYRGNNNNGYNYNNSDDQGYQNQGRNYTDSNNRNSDREHGKKRGWNGRTTPPGQQKHHHDDDNQ